MLAGLQARCQLSFLHFWSDKRQSLGHCGEKKKMVLLGAGNRKTKEGPVSGRALSIYPDADLQPELEITKGFLNHG